MWSRRKPVAARVALPRAWRRFLQSVPVGSGRTAQEWRRLCHCIGCSHHGADDSQRRFTRKGSDPGAMLRALFASVARPRDDRMYSSALCVVDDRVHLRYATRHPHASSLSRRSARAPRRDAPSDRMALFAASTAERHECRSDLLVCSRESDARDPMLKDLRARDWIRFSATVRSHPNRCSSESSKTSRGIPATGPGATTSRWCCSAASEVRRRDGSSPTTATESSRRRRDGGRPATADSQESRPALPV